MFIFVHRVRSGQMIVGFVGIVKAGGLLLLRLVRVYVRVESDALDEFLLITQVVDMSYVSLRALVRKAHLVLNELESCAVIGVGLEDEQSE